MIEFRRLRADEIECRVNLKTTNNRDAAPAYANAMLYMKARTPMAILDESVGASNWKAEFNFLNANSAMCNLSVYDDEKKEWIMKQDVGVGNEGMTQSSDNQAKSNQIKSITSDALKRAAVIWGIGRELYTGPKPIEFKTDTMNLYKGSNGYRCYDTFDITGIDYDERGVIIFLQIYDVNTKKVVYIYDVRPEELKEEEIKKVKESFEKFGLKPNDICKALGLEKFENITRSVVRQYFTQAGIEEIKKKLSQGEEVVANLPNTQKGIKENSTDKEPQDKENKETKDEDFGDFMDIPDGVEDEELPFK